MARVFVSHVVEDKKWLWGLVDALKRLGHKPFIDEPAQVGQEVDVGIQINELWYERLDVELKRVDYVLSIWSDTAQRKLKSKRGRMYAKEIAYGALTGKLLLGHIAQPRFPSVKKDRAFFADPSQPDFAALYRIIGADSKYGAHLPQIESYITDRQRFKIEGLRPKTKQMASDEGILALHREALMPPEPSKAPARVPLDKLRPAVTSIDRTRELNRLNGLLSHTDAPQSAAIQASLDCEANLLFKRLGVSERHVEWRQDYSNRADARAQDYVSRVEEVLGLLRAQAMANATPSGVVIVTQLPVSVLDGDDLKYAETIVNEWRAAIDDITPIPGTPVLFCFVLENDQFIETPAPIDVMGSTLTVPLGKVSSADLVRWSRDHALAQCLKVIGLETIPDAEGFELEAKQWIEQEIRTRVTDALTMREAILLAQRVIQEGFQKSKDGAARPSEPSAVTSIHQTAFGETN